MWLAIVAAGAANIGMNVHIPPPDTLDLEVDLGGQWVRIDLAWDVVQPVETQWNWGIYDTVVNAAKTRGLKIYATLSNTPAWASTGNRRNDGYYNDVPIAAKYRAFVQAAVARYETKIDVFGTWNEPNLGGFFEGSRQEWFDSVYRPCVQGVRAQCPMCAVAGPEIATIGSAYPEYIQAALGTDPPTILSAHIYAEFPEDDSEAGLTKDSFYNKLESHRVVAFYEAPLSIREVQLAAGKGNLPVWITEVGKGASLGDTTKLEKQRKYYERVLDAMDSRPWWAGTIFYELVQEDSEHKWGVVQRIAPTDATPLDNFAPKPAYTYLKTRLAQPSSGTDAGATADASGPSNGTDDNDAGNNAGDTTMPGGCGCRSATSPGAPLVSLIVLLLITMRRRRLRIFANAPVLLALLLVACNSAAPDPGGSDLLDAGSILLPSMIDAGEYGGEGCIKMWTLRKNAVADFDTDARAYIQDGQLHLVAWSAADTSCINPVAIPVGAARSTCTRTRSSMATSTRGSRSASMSMSVAISTPATGPPVPQ